MYNGSIFVLKHCVNHTVFPSSILEWQKEITANQPVANLGFGIPSVWIKENILFVISFLSMRLNFFRLLGRINCNFNLLPQD